MSGQGILITDQDWVVLIWDPDGADTSPWNVKASDLAGAIAQAKADWREWLHDPDEEDPDCEEPEVHKAYRGACTGERVL